MTNFNFISANETRKVLFYQLPKVLFESDKYKEMSNDAKVAYAMLKDRCEYSLQNDWVDQDGNIYFIFTTEELMKLLHIGNKKVATIKKELASFGLLLSKRMPPKTMPDGTKKGVPARLYLGQLDLTATDVFSNKKQEQQTDSPESVEKTLSGKADYINGDPQSVEKKSSGYFVSNQGFSESVDRTRNLYKTNYLDTNRHLIDSEKDQLQDQLLLDNLVELMKDTSVATFIPERSLELIKVFSASYVDAQQTIRTIHNAKYKAEKETNVSLVFEELATVGINAEQGLYTTLLKAYQKPKTETVANMQNLIFTYVKNWFIEQPIAAKIHAESKEQVPVVSLHNWLEDSQSKQ